MPSQIQVNNSTVVKAMLYVAEVNQVILDALREAQCKACEAYQEFGFQGCEEHTKNTTGGVR